MIVLDTHVFLWFILSDPRLDSSMRVQLEADPGAVFVPSVCLWESMLLVERGRLGVEVRDAGVRFMRQIADCGFVEAPLTAEIAVLSRTLEFQHEDPADRFIAATAYALGAKLATSDTRLRKLPWIELAD